MDTLKYIYINRKILLPNYLRIKARQIGCSTFASCLAPLEVEALKINPQKSQTTFSRLLDRPYKKLVSQSVHNCSCIQGYLKVQ